MADDAASKLADLLRAWREVQAGQTVEATRALGGAASQEFWSFHRQVFDLLGEVQRAIVLVGLTGKGTEKYQRHIPILYQMLTGYTASWREPQPYNLMLLDDTTLEMLEMLSDVLGGLDVTFPADPTLVSRVDSAVADVRNLLAEYPDLPIEARAYLSSLADELVAAVRDVDQFGTALVRRLSIELAGVLVAQATADDVNNKPERAKRFRDLAGRVATVIGTAVAVKAVDVAATVLQLPGTGG